MKNPLNRTKEEFIKIIDDILNVLYSQELNLFMNNNWTWLAERCLVFRFAYYLQKFFKNKGYFVDCDYNSSLELIQNKSGEYLRKNKEGKPIRCVDENWNLVSVKRFIDIIVHKRVARETDLICFEIKKWNNKTKNGMDKDVNNLKILTSEYWYKYGFHLIFWRTRNKCKINVYANGYLVPNIINEQW